MEKEFKVIHPARRGRIGSVSAAMPAKGVVHGMKNEDRTLCGIDVWASEKLAVPQPGKAAEVTCQRCKTRLFVGSQKWERLDDFYWTTEADELVVRLQAAGIETSLETEPSDTDPDALSTVVMVRGRDMEAAQPVLERFREEYYEEEEEE